MAKPEIPLHASPYWIVVADEYRALIYSRAKKFAALEQVRELTNDTARAKLADLIADRGGRSFDSHGQGRHAYTKEKSDPKLQSCEVFARSIAELAKDGQRSGRFDRIVVIAAPRFLGLLREALGKEGIEPELEIDKEVTGRDAAFIRELVDQRL